MNLDMLVGENQSIKIVPSIQESLRRFGINVDLDENTETYLRSLKTTWKTWKKNVAVELSVEAFFESVPDPHRVALIFIINCEEFKDCKLKTLPFFITETLHNWSQKKGVQPVDSLKLPAFEVATQQRSQQFLNLMVKTYQIKTIKDTIVPIVKEIISKDNSRLASHIVIAMELFDDIPIEDLLLPMIIQDKINMVDEFLNQCPGQATALVLFLDTLLNRDFSIREFVQKYLDEHKTYHVKYDRLHYKPLGKLVARICNKHNIPIETCKNLSKNRTISGLKYLIGQKYLENKVSSSVWDDLVKDSLRQNADSAKYFIDTLLDYDKKEARKWAEYLKLPESELPLALRELSVDENSTEDENWDTPHTSASTLEACYKSPLSDEQITIIDTAEKFYDLIMTELQRHIVVSIDCEWKPSFGAAQSQVALVQVGTPENVYLIDAMFLNKPEYSSFWYTFHKSFLDNAEIIKLGFGLEADLKEMKASLVGLGNMKVKGEGLLDLFLLRQYLVDIGLDLPSSCDSGGYSLSSLVQSCFGLPLEKSEQCSNWELRPLRPTQIRYAALDAYVLLELYNFLQNLCQEQEIDFEAVCNNVMQEGKAKTSVKNALAEKKKKSALINTEQSEKKVNDVKILVEPCVSPLMTYLRYCGIDTTVAPADIMWHNIINIAVSEDRLVLVGKHKSSPFGNFSQSSILDVGKCTIKEQLKRVLQNYHITVQQENLLSRCPRCNACDLKRLNRNEVSELCSLYTTEVSRVSEPSGPHVSDDEDEDLDAFLSDSDDEECSRPVACSPRNKIPCLTSKGATVEIEDVDKLSRSYKPATLCESCGKLFWEGDEFLKPVVKLVLDLINLKFNFTL